MPRLLRTCVLLLTTLLLAAGASAQIPLPDHPRPDFRRADWINLNGAWDFAPDSADAGLRDGWFDHSDAFAHDITVPFSWAAPLSGVADVAADADVGWYARTVSVPDDWAGRRVFLVVGASDWSTAAWLDGRELGEHRGGYTPFSFELTPHLQPGADHRLVLRVDDTPHPFKLEGKQGYGPARGIWQTVYLEARGTTHLTTLHLTPDIDRETVGVRAELSDPAPSALSLRVSIEGPDGPITTEQPVAAGATEVAFEVPIPEPRLWTLDDPFLYEVDAELAGGEAPDRVHTYFGMRKISVVDLPGADIPYVALNDEPVYLELALDQAYHPEGFYTFPDDAFTRDEILRARQIGLNGVRVHVKIALPRKLYWADRLGMLVMADVPNSWGEPDDEMRFEVTYALREMIRRDFNHPSIFAWVPFNETWGLYTTVEENGRESRRYLPSTQRWVTEVVQLAKSLDPTRLVEDNSVCCGRGHTETDLNSWHLYAPGWTWATHLDSVVAGTYPGSTWNFEEGYRQSRQPNINSEFGNVWGYEGSTGDVDWTWDYHRAVNEFRRHPAVAGWLYTEHHDVINEWNGYWRYDRSEKITGLDELVEGMSLRDFHSPLYVSTGVELSREAPAGSMVEVPLFASFMTGSTAYGDALTLRAALHTWNTLGEHAVRPLDDLARTVAYRPWRNEALDPLTLRLPDAPGLALLELRLEDPAGQAVYHRNFTTFVVAGDPVEPAGERRLTVPAAGFSDASWSTKQWDVLDGLKVNGAGSGYFTYRMDWPADVDRESVASAVFFVEASAKQLFGKDRDEETGRGGDYMRGGGFHDPSANPNAYPMTDETRTPSAVHVSVNGVPAGVVELPDDPADHRGILSWHSQLRDRRLREAGSYGYRVSVPVPSEALDRAARDGALEIRLEVDDAFPGGLAIYGSRFGRYPMDPTVVLTLREK